MVPMAMIAARVVDREEDDDGVDEDIWWFVSHIFCYFLCRLSLLLVEMPACTCKSYSPEDIKTAMTYLGANEGASLFSFNQLSQTNGEGDNRLQIEFDDIPQVDELSSTSVYSRAIPLFKQLASLLESAPSKDMDDFLRFLLNSINRQKTRKKGNHYFTSNQLMRGTWNEGTPPRAAGTENWEGGGLWSGGGGL